MPELPEVEIVKRGAAKMLKGAEISDIEVLWPKSFQVISGSVDDDLIGAAIKGFERRGKAIIISLSSGYFLMIHLKMTGQVIVCSDESRFAAGHPNDSFISKMPDNSTRVIIDFAGGQQLFFNDQRKFGWIRLMSQSDLDNDKFLNSLGPDTSNVLDAAEVIARAPTGSKRSVKSIILDQKIISGVGNIYADEGLFMAGINPETLWNELSKDQIQTLLNSLAAVMQKSIELGGSSDRNYVQADGGRGNYLDHAQVFRREGRQCLKCGQEIQKSRIAGRGTHTCPTCQPKP